MIVSADRKTVVVGVPKNGSQTLHKVLAPLGTALVGFRGGHPYPTRLSGLLEAAGVQFDTPPAIYAFWRDPVERFVSAVEFYKRTLPAAVMGLLPGKFDGAPRPKAWFYEDGTGVPAASKSAMTGVSAEDVLKSLPMPPPMLVTPLPFELQTNVVFQPQAYWMDTPGITILPFSTFEAGLKSLVTLFGGDAGSVVIPQVNAAQTKPAALPVKVADAVKSYYAMDYQFNPTK